MLPVAFSSSRSLRGKPGYNSLAVPKICKNPFCAYASFLLTGSFAYHCLGGSFGRITTPDLLGYVATVAEGFGLIMLKQSINRRGGVMGISRSSMIMFALAYASRIWELWPSTFTKVLLDAWVVEILSVVELLLVLDILWSMFVTNRKSYQEDLDVLKVWHMIPGCAVLALLVHPSFGKGVLYDYEWASSFYVDVLSLLPQVVMMAQGGGRVQAPIAHFVAATALSRALDLFWWYYNFDVGRQGYIGDFNYSGWQIVIVHVLNLLLVGDFMYYYVKARVSGAALSEDLELDLEDLCL